MMATPVNKLIFTFLAIFFLATSVFSNNLQITNVTYDEGNNTLNFDISWDNAFYVNSDWQDHVYIFAKYKNSNGSSWDRVMFELSGHSDDATLMTFGIAPSSLLLDGKRLGMKAGHFSTFSSGTQGANCTALLADNIDFFHPSFKVFGIEMVQISNTGNDYYLGDGTSENRWHKGDDTTEAYLWEQVPSASINVGNGPDDINTTLPIGILVASISEHIFRPPNNIMKYEISQIQYVEFLNSLNRTAQNNRVGTDISGTSITDVFVMTETPTVATFTRNGIRVDATLPNGGPVTFYCDYNGNGIPNENDDGQNIALNYLSGEDLFAFLDWSGLTPLNEMEYEQICRGSFNPVPNEFAWGTSGYTHAFINSGPTYGTPEEYLNQTPLIGPMVSSQNPMRCGGAATATTNRVTSGASAYGIMELSGNVSELVISLRTANSFNTIVNGSDGSIDNFGNTNENWPQEIASKGFYQNSPGGAKSVSHRQPNGYPYTARSSFYGGRGGY